VNAGDPDAPWNAPDINDKWRWFQVSVELDVFTQTEDDVRDIIEGLTKLGTPKWSYDQKKLCISVDDVKISSEEEL